MLDWIFPREQETRSASLENPSVSLNDPDAWKEYFGVSMMTDTGTTVSHTGALTLSPFWKAVNMISGDCSKLPLEVFQRRDDGGKDLDFTHDAYWRIGPYGMANDETTSLEFWRQMFVAKLIYQNACAWIDRSNGGQLLGLYFLLPDRTEVVRKNGRKWVLTEVGGKIEALPYADCIHLRGLSLDGVAGRDLVMQAREEIAQALAARQFTSRFFRNGLHAGGVLQVPPGTSPKAKQKVEKAIANRSGAENAFRSLILRDGFKWFKTMVDPKEAQLVEITDQKARDIANFFMMWPGRLGVKDSISYNSIEQERRDYYDTTLSYHLTGVRAECNAKLLSEQDRKSRRRFIDYNVNALLWTDAASVAEIGYGGVERGVLTPDEVRGWWNMNPLPDGAGRNTRVPLNTTPANTAGNGDAVPTGSSGGTRSTNAKHDDAAGIRDSAGVQTNRDSPGPRVVTHDMRSAIKTILAATIERCATRWSIHADRAAKRGAASLTEFLQTTINEHDEVCNEMLDPVVRAGIASGIVLADLPILPRLRAAFVAEREKSTGVDVRAFVAAHLPSFVEETP